MPWAAKTFQPHPRVGYKPRPRQRTAERGYDGPWQRFAKQYLRQHPVCVACEVKPATQVDHIRRMSDGGDKWDDANLQALCHGCHSRKTKREGKRNED